MVKKHKCIRLEKRKIKVSFVAELEFPEDMEDNLIDFSLNQGSYCSSNILDYLQRLDEEQGCLCGFFTFEILPLI